jgi:hypothetical protein
MKRCLLAESQIVKILKATDAEAKVNDVCNRHSSSY